MGEGETLFFSAGPRRFARLRAGWRLLLFFALIQLGFDAAGALAAHWRWPLAGLSPGGILLSELIFFGVFLAISTLFARLEGRGLGAFGLPGREAFGPRFGVGLVWGLAALASLLLLMRATGDFAFGARALHGAAVERYAVAWAAVFLTVGFAEEFSFRGYALATLAQGVGFWPAAVASSAVFGWLHLGNGGENAMGGLLAALMGLFFCFTLRRTGNLWFAIGMHAGWDWAETFLFGVPDSGLSSPGQLMAPVFHGPAWITGGTVGPEGSVLALAVIVLLFPVFARWGPAPRGPAAAVSPPD